MVPYVGIVEKGIAKARTKNKTTAATRPTVKVLAEANEGKPLAVWDRIVVCRKAKGIRKSAAAKALGITQQSYGDLESGKSKQPAADTLLDMRDSLGFNPDYVIRGKGMALLPNFESLAQEQALILIFRELRPEIQREAVKSVQALRRAQGGASRQDPFQEDAPDDDD